MSSGDEKIQAALAKPESGEGETPLGFVCSRPELCALCKLTCEVGQRIIRVYLVEEEQEEDVADAKNSEAKASKENPKRRAWVHLECALENKCTLVDVGAKICKHWRRTGTCTYGENCQFLHPQTEAGVAPAERRVRGGKRRFVRKAGRVGVLRRFLLDEFGLERLEQGSGVLDVAGGRGELAFELANLNGIQATVLDPRPLQVSNFVRKFQLGMYHRNLGKRGVSHVTRKPTDELVKLSHLSLYMDADLVELVRQSCIDDNVWQAHMARARGLAWTRKGLHEADDVEDEDEEDEETHQDPAEDADTEPNPEESEFFNELETGEEVLKALQECSVVVGMHPDQATEPMVDLALLLGVPFAVVPCCVYSKLFPGRALRDGTPVRSHATLVSYLCEKDPEIHVKKLDFEGKNTVVYYKGH